MASLYRRITSLEKHGTVQPVAWAEVDAALRRQEARVRLKVCRGLGLDAADPRVLNAAALLPQVSDTQQAQDAETLQRWRRQQGIPADDGDVRQRISARLDEMGRRLGGGT